MNTRCCWSHSYHHSELCLHDSFILIPSNNAATANITGIEGLHERIKEDWICYNTVETEIVVAFPVWTIWITWGTQYFFCDCNEGSPVSLKQFYINKIVGRQHGKNPAFQFHTYFRETKKRICLLNIWNIFLQFYGIDVGFSFIHSSLCFWETYGWGF